MDELKTRDIVKVIGSDGKELGVGKIAQVPDEFGRQYFLIAMEMPGFERGDGVSFHLSDGRRLELVFRA